jgi:protein arginine N-methyltransferase 1
MTNSPLAAGKINRAQIFLPIDEPQRVKAGEQVEAMLMARPDDPLLAWSVDFPSGGRRFAHSTWQGMLLSPEDLQRSAPERIPAVSRRGRARGIVLQYCDGRRTARDIEHAVLREHPGLLPSRAEISRFVAGVLGGDTE